MISFEEIDVGKKYERPYLAKLWDYKSFNAISRGVITPINQKIIVFFITKEKQQSLTQYEDHIDADILYWEGEKSHRTDQRITSKEDEIHIFYRDRHHTPFIYRGRALLKTFRLLKDQPSKFIFTLIDNEIKIKEIIDEIQKNHELLETEKKAIIRARVGQGIYRRESIKLWKRCSLTGFSVKSLLLASHIKPWKLSSNMERLDPFNSLLVVPTIDKLFDKGYISFQDDGRILLSRKIRPDDYMRINLSPDLRLCKVPELTKNYLEYHREYIYDYRND